MAIAIVRNGKIELARGFGKRALGREEPVSEHTRFPIASLTKTFTAAAAGSLAVEGKLGWDEPIATKLPGFALKDPRVSAELTLRDALAHRSGLSESADLLWLGTGYDRAEVVSRLRFVGQAAPLRASFSYSNVLYVVAGELAARASGQAWEELVRARLLEPAGMREIDVGKSETSDIASPHAERDGEIRAIPPRDVDNIGPAAGLRASAADLARWMLVLLGRGEIEGKRVLDERAVDAMLTPQMLVGLRPWQKALYPESHFLAQGMGIMLQDFRGRMVAWGTGGIDGFSCSMAIVPEENLGVVVLTNIPYTGLPEGMVFWLLDAHLGGGGKDWSGIRLKMSLDSRARGAAARKEHEGAKESTALPFAADKLVGTYVSELLGEAEIAIGKDGKLGLRIAKSMRATIEPWRKDVLRATFEDGDLGSSLVKFELGKDGSVARFELDDHGKFERLKKKK
jgi:CubicO group peptidase (beta-lactamase class C family)